MKKSNPSKPQNTRQADDNPEPEGYPLYPPEEDIYSQFKEEPDIDPEDLTRKKPADETIFAEEEELDPLDDDIMGTDLDVPGAELDDDSEEIGNEDEENNYYSIGGDNHNNLEEDQGEEFP